MTIAPSRPVPPAPGGPARRRTPRWAKVLIGMGVLLLVAGFGGAPAGRWLIDRAAGAFTQQDLLGATDKPSSGKGSVWMSVLGRSRLTGPVDILLMGVDAR